MSAGQRAEQGPRALRAMVFAAVCVLLAALGHAVMSGSDVPWWAVAVALSGTAGCAWFLAGRERGPLLVTLATVGAQAGLHLFFSLAQTVAQGAGPAAVAQRMAMNPGRMLCGAHGMTAQTMTGGHSMTMGHAMSGMPMGAMDGMDVMPAHTGHGAAGMWSAHLLVALVCGIWLSGGEQAAFRLGRAVGARLFAPLLVLFHGPVSAPCPPRIRGGLGRAAQRLRQLLYAHVLVTRGPPAACAALG
ncbi:hypothetical protein ACIHFE_21525 [Streptomyces sp. NPDC052396]|uniref:hypothetical protein n=1 Tax=Streptomyces sp. NPDC052396 TaxID=3365689 RepID=UPI0037D5E8A6